MNQPPTDAKGFATWLIAHGACKEGRTWAGGKTLPEVWQSCQNGEWLEWLLDECGYTWTAEVMAEYHRAKAPALAKCLRETDTAAAEYRRVVALARDEYERVAAPAWAEYERVAAPAWAEYWRAVDAAHAECERVKARAIRGVIGYPFSDEGNED